MGRWKVEGTENVLGDDPLEGLGGAVMMVVWEYRATFNRRPTKAEWEALLMAALGGEGPEQKVTDDGIVKIVRVESGRAIESLVKTWMSTTRIEGLLATIAGESEGDRVNQGAWARCGRWWTRLDRRPRRRLRTTPMSRLTGSGRVEWRRARLDVCRRVSAW